MTLQWPEHWTKSKFLLEDSSMYRQQTHSNFCRTLPIQTLNSVHSYWNYTKHKKTLVLTLSTNTQGDKEWKFSICLTKIPSVSSLSSMSLAKGKVQMLQVHVPARWHRFHIHPHGSSLGPCSLGFETCTGEENFAFDWYEAIKSASLPRSNFNWG